MMDCVSDYLLMAAEVNNVTSIDNSIYQTGLKSE